MARKIQYDNHRVVVYPVAPWIVYIDKEHDTYRRVCDDIAQAIRRHVDDVAAANVEWDTNPVCEYCGERWTETSEIYNGGCCDKDEEHRPELGSN